MFTLLDILEAIGGLVGIRSRRSRMRVTAGHWIELAERVWHYRRDQLTGPEAQDLLARTEELRRARRERADPARLKLLIDSLEGTLGQVGGRLYRRGSFVENVEFFLVAAIVIFGIRTYFLQPFKIPTNSMWPSYHGMTPQVYRDPETVPGRAMQAVRLLAFGAVHHEVTAPASGPISVPLLDGRVYYTQKPGRRWFVLPAQVREYTFYVGDQPLRFTVPLDFDFDWAFREAFGLTAREVMDLGNSSTRSANGGIRLVTLPQQAVAGRPFLSFEVLTGDQLFVDRFSYHFFRPKVGQGFVFRTGNIPGIAMEYGDQYYIKRLVGVPGDEIEIQPPVLMRNGSPISGSPAFERNARRVDRYSGYGFAPESRAELLGPGEITKVPQDAFLALGDNSANSADGRYWGFVPAADVVGKPFFIYFPFTSRWGRAP